MSASQVKLGFAIVEKEAAYEHQADGPDLAGDGGEASALLSG